MLRFALVFLLVYTPVFSQNSEESVSDTLTPKLFNSAYMPLKDGINYIYDSSFGQTEMSMEKEDSTFRVSYNGAGIEYSQNLHNSNGHILLTKTENEILFWGKTVTYESPVTRIPFPIKIGDTWSWTGMQSIEEYSGEVTISGELLAEESITTEAGTFECIKIEMTIKIRRKTDRLIEWLAPGIGIVKSEAHLASGGFTGTIQSILGLDVIEFELVHISD